MRFDTSWGSKTAATEQAERLALIFGGSNLIEGIGRWYDDEGNLWLEPSYTVTVHTDAADARRQHNSITRLVLDQSDQLSVLVALPDGSHYLMERSDGIA